MYTGIVTHRGTLEDVAPATGADEVMRLVIRPDAPIEGLSLGDSMAIDGCCLTVVAIDEDRLSFDAIPETLRKTTLGARRVGEVVNLEAPLKMGDALGGHMVQGHVDGVGTVRAVERQGEDVRMVIALPETLRGDVLPKGSVTIDGVSLTVGEVFEEDAEARFSVYLIPHTLAVTGLGTKAEGDRVNLEADMFGRWVKHHLVNLGDFRRGQPGSLG